MVVSDTAFTCTLYTIALLRFTMLVGKPPFETKTLKDTYQRIKRNEYHIPHHISLEARTLITKLLRPNPSSRPTAMDILDDPFFTSGHMPVRLPVRFARESEGLNECLFMHTCICTKYFCLHFLRIL